MRDLNAEEVEVESRRVHGEGIEHEQNAIQERLEVATNTDEYAEAAERLDQVAEDLAQSTSGSDEGDAASDSMLAREAGLPTESAELRRGSTLDANQNSAVDPDLTPPDAEARTRTARSVGPNLGS